jgi:hypothetical protein
VIRRLATQGQLPSGFHADVPPSPRVPAAPPVAAPMAPAIAPLG